MAEKDSLIQQKEKLYVELKAILARQPGPEVAEQLSIYQASYLFFRNVAHSRASRGLRWPSSSRSTRHPTYSLEI